MQRIIQVGSSSSIKLTAVSNGIKSLCERQVWKETKMKANETKSNIAEQPFGYKMIQEGVENRLKQTPGILAVAFETGLIEKENGRLYDISYAKLRTNVGTFEGWSKHIQRVPDSYQRQWKALSEDQRANTTIGSLIEQRMDGVDGKDWYKIAFRAEKSRLEVLTDLFKALFLQYIRQLESIPVLIPHVIKHRNVDFIDIQQNFLTQPKELQIVVENLTFGLLYDVVILIDARGFLFANCFPGRRIVFARKPGKLPDDTLSVTYQKEYEEDRLCIQREAIPLGSSVIIVDDVIATGNSMVAVQELVQLRESKVVAYIAPYALASADNTLMCDGKIPKEKLRFAQTQYELPEWELIKQKQQSNLISIVPPSLNTFSDIDRVSVKWGKFCFSSNVQFKECDIRNHEVSVYINLLNMEEMLDVISLLKILYTKEPKKITVIIPFFEHATQDRIEYDDEGYQTLAQVDTIRRLIGKFKVITYDLHALQSVFPFFILENRSLVAELWNLYRERNPNVIPVFPDAGSKNRYGKLPGMKNAIVFTKKRGPGTERIVMTDDEIKTDCEYVILDDLCRTGFTMHNVAFYLLKNGARAVDCLFAHAPLEPSAAKNFDIFRDVYTTNTCPGKVPNEWIKIAF